MSDSVGVIVGRFQVGHLHDEHLKLLQHMTETHEKSLVFLGVHRTPDTKRNPLSFEVRKAMILGAFPDVTVLPITDIPNDEDWNRLLEEEVWKVVPKGTKVELYGGRDSAVQCYSHEEVTKEQKEEATHGTSGTAQREEIGKTIRDSQDFREGIIHAYQNRPPTSWQTVDIVCYDPDRSRIVLIRKADEKKWRLPGGFVDVTDSSLEYAAVRELHEEVGMIETADTTYLGSFRSTDWRYRKEEDKIMTTLFYVQFVFGALTAGDDAAEAKWFDAERVIKGRVPFCEGHKVLIRTFAEALEE